MLTECPCCGARDFHLEIPEEEIAFETRLRAHFARKRAPAGDTEALQDSAVFTHNDTAAVYACSACGVLVRDDVDVDFTEVYANDSYDEEVLASFLERDIRYFSEEKEDYAVLLPPGARVIELGSYAGGFLHVAASWGWEALGVDVGQDVTRFANRRGYHTIRGTLENCDIESASVDGVFVWNCFDQLTDPAGTLDEIHRILRPGGVVVLRTPNALFYRLCRPFLAYTRETQPEDLADSLIARVMGYNNMLGFPYQFGYAPSHLRTIAERHGFEPVRTVASNLVVFPESETPGWAIREQEQTFALLNGLSQSIHAIHPEVYASPWIELIARRPA